MKKLLLLDANVIIDLHSSKIFQKVAKAHDVYVTREVFKEAKYYPKGNQKIPIDISDQVSIIEEIDLDCLEMVFSEAKEAHLAVDDGEATSIAYISEGKKEVVFCASDKAAITLISYMGLDENCESLEKILAEAGHKTKLLPRHLEKNFKNWISVGKALRVQFKKLY